MSKQKLLLISDLWGREKSEWIIHYTSILEHHFELKFYDSCELGAVNKISYTSESLHNQFINGGIEKAVANLILKEKENVSVLGFSIGGTIAWKAGLSGLKIDNLIAVSSTRLRYETEKPLTKVKLFYGEKDSYRPDNMWVQKMNQDVKLFLNEDHECYTSKEIAERICKKILVIMI